jgi:hypothetical protein
MSGINIAQTMSRKKVVKNLNGDIIDMMDESGGGWIIRKGQVVNKEAYEEILKIEKDRQMAAKAQAEAVNNPMAPDRTINPTQNKKVDDLEKKVNDMDSKLDSILKAINNK